MFVRWGAGQRDHYIDWHLDYGPRSSAAWFFYRLRSSSWRCSMVLIFRLHTHCDSHPDLGCEFPHVYPGFSGQEKSGIRRRAVLYQFALESE